MENLRACAWSIGKMPCVRSLCDSGCLERLPACGLMGTGPFIAAEEWRSGVERGSDGRMGW